MRTAATVLLLVLLVLGAVALWWRFRPAAHADEAVTASPGYAAKAAGGSPEAAGPTRVYAHNLMLRRGPHFRVYVRWLRGEMAPTRRGVNPSFDDPESFFLNVKTGVLRANIGDIGTFLSAGVIARSPLKNITLSADGDEVKLTGTLHKIVPLPVEMTGTVAVAGGSRIRLHVTKLKVLKIPFKGLLGAFHVDISDLFQPRGTPGIEVSGSDILFDTQVLLPAPHIRGDLAKVRVVARTSKACTETRKRTSRGWNSGVIFCACATVRLISANSPCTMWI